MEIAYPSAVNIRTNSKLVNICLLEELVHVVKFAANIDCLKFFNIHLSPLIIEPQGVHPCDRRKSISEYRPIFPAIDFSMASSLS